MPKADLAAAFDDGEVLAVLLDVIKPGLDAEGLLDHLLPAGTVEEAGLRTALHELVPALGVLRLHQLDLRWRGGDGAGAVL